MDLLNLENYYHIPIVCAKCGGVMIYKGVGEYQCEKCGFLDYDDYGKTRCYIEEHRGATAVEIEAATGVTQRTIRRMLKESRIEIAEGSKTFLHCEVCSKNIRSGRFCPECEMKAHRNLEERERERQSKAMKVYGKGEQGDVGQKRFKRDDK
ncbi:MAG: MerR family transcriptional regulator [Lachnospiraceae bacterium]|nr:MerR family transcriptional regulator [Lachnospiraceae bacterium]